MAQVQNIPAEQPMQVIERPAVEWADAWLKLTGIRTTFRERELLVLQFKQAMDYAVQKERCERDGAVSAKATS